MSGDRTPGTVERYWPGVFLFNSDGAVSAQGVYKATGGCGKEL